MAAASSSDSFACPHCGAELAEDAQFCRACGASEDSGWPGPEEQSSEEWALEEEDDFDYDAFVASEFPDHSGEVGVLKWVLLALFAMGALFCVFGTLVLGR